MKATDDRNEKGNPQIHNLRQSLEKGIASSDKMENESSSDLVRQVEALQKNLMEMKEQLNYLEKQSLIKDNGDEEAFPDDDRAFVGADEDDDENEVDTLVSDSFSLIMVSSKYSAPWLLGISTFLLQVLLCTFIAINQIQQSHNSSLFNVPFTVDRIVTVAQFLSIFFCVCIQSDVLESIQIISILWKDSNWRQVIPVQNRDDFGSWMLHIFLPNFCKFLQGMLVLFISFVVIVQSDHIIDLFKDFSALTVISQLDDLVFFLARAGFIGRNLKSEAIRVEKIEFRESKGTKRNWFVIRPFILVTITATMVGGWMYVVIQQLNGSIFHARYPDCDASFLDAKTHFGDGKCYGGNLNTLGCEFEDGDCVNFNIQYPLCRGNELLNVQEELANDECNIDFSIPDCDFDNFACCDKDIVKSASFGDGLCTAGKANTEQCMFDNNDCLSFNLNFPRCPVLEASGNDGIVLGDGECNGGLLNTYDCGYENGDCEKTQLGQDLVFHGAFNQTSSQVKIFSVLSLDGSTVVIGLPATNSQDIFDINSGGRVRILKYEKDRMEWVQNTSDLIDDDGGIMFGRKVAINENGSRVAVSGGRNGQEYIKVFDITEDSFQQIGQTLMRDSTGSTRHLSIVVESSWSFDITANGSRLAVASDTQVQVFDLLDEGKSSSKWTQIGDPIVDDGIFSVRLNADDGSKLVYDKFIRYLSGNSDVITEVFSLRENTWTQIGGEILTFINYDQVPTGVASAISGDGEIIVKSLACNNPGSPGSVQAYKVRDEDVDPFGYTIQKTDGSHNGDDFGCSIALSRDGMNLAVSSLNFECMEGPDTCATGSIELFTRDTYDFLPMLTKNKFENNEFTISRLSSSSIFGFQASLGESEEISLILSSVYFNFESGKTTITVHDLEKEFYPECGMSPEKRQDGSCDSFYNTKACLYDLGECDEFNSMYPGCKVEFPDKVGDKYCDLGDYNSEECDWDGGACVEFNKFPNCTVTSYDISSLGDKRCDSKFNTIDCGFDLGDCIEFNTNYPNCTASFPYRIGNGSCDLQFNISTCGWDGGDCL